MKKPVKNIALVLIFTTSANLFSGYYHYASKYYKDLVSNYYHYTSKCKALEKAHPYAFLNIRIIISTLLSVALLKTALKTKKIFVDAPEKEIKLIKKIAKEFQLHQKIIETLKVKSPTPNSELDFKLKNNFFASFNTIILGNCYNSELNNLFTNNINAKKFIYAHELTHIKKNHNLKKLFLLISSPFATHYGIKGLNKAFSYFYKKIFNKSKNHLYIEKINRITSSLGAKVTIQFLTLLFLSRKMEKEADRGAALLGTNIANGGIDFFNTLTKIKLQETESMLNEAQGIRRKILSFFVKVRTYFPNIFGTHPTNEERIKNLQAIIDMHRSIEIPPGPGSCQKINSQNSNAYN